MSRSTSRRRLVGSLRGETEISKNARAPRALSGYERSLVFGVCFAAVLVLNLSLIAMPPVWDAVGVFAPAIFLYENDLDLPALLASPGYLEGGPNIHSLSLITFITLGAIAFTGGEPSLYIPALHVLNFGLAAAVIAGTFILARRLMGDKAAVLVAVALLLFPLFLVQTGMLHTEIAGAALGITALMAFAQRRFGCMTALVVTACLVKSFGVVLVVGLGALLLCDLAMSFRQRLCWLAAVAVPAVVVECARWTTAYAAIGPPQTFTAHLGRMAEDLLLVPDILTLGALSILSAVTFVARVVRANPRTALEDEDRRIEAACLLLPIVMFSFVALAPLSGASLLPLPRYYVWVLAPMLIGVAAGATRHAGARPTVLVLASFVLFLDLNRDGALYPDSREKIVSFSIAERSLAYLDFYEIQRAAVEGVVELTGGQPVFVTRGEYYYLSSARMGWVDREIPHLHFVHQLPLKKGVLSEDPTEFFALESSSNYYHGLREIRKFVSNAARHPRWDSERVARWERGPYEAELHRIRRVQPDDPSANEN